MKAIKTTDVDEALRKRGYRLTPQRLLIVAAVQSSDDHVSAEEIYAQVRSRYPHINLSTVYRTLELLRDLGIVLETDLGQGRIQYHLAERGRHHHLICRHCETISDLDSAVFETLEQTLRERYHFQANLNHFSIFGVCGACQEASLPRN